MTDTLLIVDVQVALSDDSEEPPAPKRISHWANVAYETIAKSPCEVTIRLVDEAEMIQLNESYRGKQGSTNVLSFPFENEFEMNTNEGFLATENYLSAADSMLVDDYILAESSAPSESDEIDTLLGDIVICHAVLKREAKEQKKSEADHYAHMVTHGVLHLCGYDHMDDAEAEEMEALEVKILKQSHIQNPYT